MCVSTPGQKVFVHWFNGRGCLEKAPKPATCVCPPLDKGFPSTTPIRQGGQACHIQPGPTKLGCDRGSTRGRFGVYLPRNFCTSCPPYSSTFCFMVLHVFHPTNRFLSAADRRLAQLCSRVFRVRLETMFNHTVPADFSTLRFFAILPIGEIELTEYKLSKCLYVCMYVCMYDPLWNNRWGLRTPFYNDK